MSDLLDEFEVDDYNFSTWTIKANKMLDYIAQLNSIKNELERESLIERIKQFLKATKGDTCTKFVTMAHDMLRRTVYHDNDEDSTLSKEITNFVQRMKHDISTTTTINEKDINIELIPHEYLYMHSSLLPSFSNLNKNDFTLRVRNNDHKASPKFGSMKSSPQMKGQPPPSPTMKSLPPPNKNNLMNFNDNKVHLKRASNEDIGNVKKKPKLSEPPPLSHLSITSKSTIAAASTTTKPNPTSITSAPAATTTSTKPPLVPVTTANEEEFYTLKKDDISTDFEKITSNSPMLKGNHIEIIQSFLTYIHTPGAENPNKGSASVVNLSCSKKAVLDEEGKPVIVEGKGQKVDLNKIELNYETKKWRLLTINAFVKK